jgi:hypothetical protein
LRKISIAFFENAKTKSGTTGDGLLHHRRRPLIPATLEKPQTAQHVDLPEPEAFFRTEGAKFNA